jgi:low affinity Fe/Cu permease
MTTRTEARHFRKDLFTKVSGWTIRATGGRWGFLLALLVVIVWALSGPFFKFSANWQLFMNTTSAVVTFLMVFLIQNAQIRESKAIHIKLDELIFAVRQARNELLDIENLTEEQLDRITSRYKQEAQLHQHKLRKVIEPDEETPEVKPPVTSR